MPDDGETEEGAVTGKKKPTSYAETLMHMIKAYLGTGIFAMGDAYKNTGYVMGTIVLGIVAIMSVYCQHLLVFCIKKVEEELGDEAPTRQDYGEAAKQSFLIGTERWHKWARHMKNLVNTFLLICEVGTCCTYTVFIGEHLMQVCESWGWQANIHVHMSYAIVVLWLITFISNLKLLAPLSYGANVITLISCFMIYYITTKDPLEMDLVVTFAPPQRYAMGLGTMLFAFAGIVAVPTLRIEMKNRERMGGVVGVLNVSAFVVFLVYVSIGLVSYIRYSEFVQGSVFLNFPTEGKVGTVCDITKFLIVLATCISFIIHMYIISEVSYPIYYKKMGPFKHETFQLALFKTMLVLFVFVLANVIPFLNLFISLTGALTGSVLVLMMTPVMQFVAFHGALNLFFIISNIIVLIFGVVGMLIGTALSIYEIYKAVAIKYNL